MPEPGAQGTDPQALPALALAQGAAPSASHISTQAGADVSYPRRPLPSGARHQDRFGKVLIVNSGNESIRADAGVDAVNPWEERKDRGRFPALLASLVLLATAPRRFFEGTRPAAGIRGPLVFVGLVAVVASLLNGVVLTVLHLTLPAPAFEFVHLMEIWLDQSVSGTEDLPFGRALSSLIFLQLLLLFLPFIFLFSLIFAPVLGALMHLLLLVTRTPKPQGFRGTVAAMCYAYGAAILGVLPVAGDFLAAFTIATLLAIGLHVIQGVSLRRAAAFASILPLLTLLQLIGRLLEAGVF